MTQHNTRVHRGVFGGLQYTLDAAPADAKHVSPDVGSNLVKLVRCRDGPDRDCGRIAVIPLGGALWLGFRVCPLCPLHSLEEVNLPTYAVFNDGSLPTTA